MQPLWLGTPMNPQVFIVVGMGAFLAATTHAPIMAIIMLFELTLDYELILPLMLACVVAHYACLAFEQKSIYAESLKRKGGELSRHQNAFRDLCISRGIPFSVTYGRDEPITVLEAWGACRPRSACLTQQESRG